jgi:hypothetical protein
MLEGKLITVPIQTPDFTTINVKYWYQEYKAYVRLTQFLHLLLSVLLSFEGGSSKSHYMEEFFWRRRWTCRQPDYWMMSDVICTYNITTLRWYVNNYVVSFINATCVFLLAFIFYLLFYYIYCCFYAIMFLFCKHFCDPKHVLCHLTYANMVRYGLMMTF